MGPSFRFSESDISLGPEKLVVKHPTTQPLRPWQWWIQVHLLFVWRWFLFHLPRIYIEWRWML